MGKPELFSYLSAFVTIVLAVALTDMIQSTHRLLRARRRVQWDARPLVLAAIVAIAVISEFFSLWSKLDREAISMGRLLWLLTTPTVFALLAYAVLPDDVPEAGIDLTAFWQDERRSWAILLVMVTLLDFARGVEEAASAGYPLRGFLTFGAPLLIASLASFAMIFFARGKLWSWAGLLLYSAVVVYVVMGWTVAADATA